jgi:hypothetical protein
MADLRDKLVDRGLFMLTLGHVVIVFAQVPIAGGGWTPPSSGASSRT